MSRRQSRIERAALDATAARRRRSRQRLLLGAGVLVLLGAGAVVFALLRQRAADQRAIDDLVQETHGAVAAAEPQRDVVLGLLRRVEARPENASDPRLVHARVRLLLALDRAPAAFDVIAPLAMSPAATAADLLLGARALARSYALNGKRDDALRAIDLARRSYEAESDSEPLFLAWQVATWVGATDAAASAAGALRERQPGTPQARLAELYGSLDFEQPAPAAAAIEELVAALPASAEAAFLRALLRLHSSVERERQRGADDLQSVLDRVPAYIDARIVAVAAHEMLGEQSKRDGHLRWLLTNAPDDPRRPAWEQRLQRPIR